MSEINNNKKPMSAYQQLSGIINALKTEEMSLNDAMSKIQLKDTDQYNKHFKLLTKSYGTVAFNERHLYGAN